jgi:hypothetical protein
LHYQVTLQIRLLSMKGSQTKKKKPHPLIDLRRNLCGLIMDHIHTVVMFHVVKGRQYSAYTVLHAGASITEMVSETDSRSSFDASTTGTWSIYSFRTSDWSVVACCASAMRATIFSTRLALFIYGITCM